MEFNLYLVTNLLDGTMYVGKTTKSIKRRWQQHKGSHLDKGDYLHRAMRKHGADAFTIEPLILLDEDFIDEASLNTGEVKMIRLLRVNCRLYNLTAGGEGSTGYKPSEETRRKLSEALKGNRYAEGNRGKPKSEDHRRKIGDARRGKHCGPLSPEHLRKLSESHKGNNYNLGHKHTAEARQHMAEARKGRVISGETRRKLSEAGKGEHNWNWGKKASEETRRKLSESHRKAWATRRTAQEGR